MLLWTQACTVRANRRVVDERRVQAVREKLGIRGSAEAIARSGQKRKAEVPLEVIVEEVD